MSVDRGKRKGVYRLAVLVLALGLLVSGGYLVWKNMDYQKGAADYEAAAVSAGVPPLKTVPVPEQGEEAPLGDGGADPEAPQKVSDEDLEAPEKVSDPNLELLADMDLSGLQETNGDVLGWIVIPDTVLSYPLVQGEDNQYYLRHTWQDGQSSVGAIFMECKCSPDLSDFNTILYGHNMRNGSMFGALHGYKEEDFWKEHPTVYVVTDDAARAYEVYAAFEAGIREIVYRLGIEEQEEKEELIRFCREHSEIDTGVVPTAVDQLLTLSTCTGRGHDTRWIVQAVLREEILR